MKTTLACCTPCRWDWRSSIWRRHGPTVPRGPRLCLRLRFRGFRRLAQRPLRRNQAALPNPPSNPGERNDPPRTDCRRRPVGLTLAVELARYRVPVRIVDKVPDPHRQVEGAGRVAAHARTPAPGRLRRSIRRYRSACPRVNILAGSETIATCDARRRRKSVSLPADAAAVGHRTAAGRAPGGARASRWNGRPNCSISAMPTAR